MGDAGWAGTERATGDKPRLEGSSPLGSREQPTQPQSPAGPPVALTRSWVHRWAEVKLSGAKRKTERARRSRP